MAGTSKKRVNWLPKRLSRWANKISARKTANATHGRPRSRDKPPAWQVHEGDVARLLGGRRTPQSGAGAEKGDVRVESRRLLIECKLTVQASRSVTLSELQKCALEAAAEACVPVFALRFLEGAENHDYVIVPLAYYADLIRPEPHARS